jgi:hypothetical protein
VSVIELSGGRVTAALRKILRRPVMAVEGEFCGHKDCKGHSGGHHVQETVITWTSEPPPDFLKKNAGVTYRDH